MSPRTHPRKTLNECVEFLSVVSTAGCEKESEKLPEFPSLDGHKNLSK